MRLSVVGLLSAIGAVAAFASCALDSSEKHRCAIDADCTSGRVCRAGTCVQEDTEPNVMFVTSTTRAPRFQPLEVADDQCNALAAHARLTGTYRAWLSTSMVDARDRLGDARGWVRPDGVPFVDTVDDLVNGRIFNPPFVDETGRDTHRDAAAPVATGTNPFGFVTADANCNDWLAEESGPATGGDPSATSLFWTTGTTANCGQLVRLYCFGIDRRFPVHPTPGPGKRIFVSDGYFALGGGLASADAQCAQEALDARIGGSFMALLPTSASSVVDRFGGATTPTWRRLDDVTVNAPGSNLLAGDPLISPLNLTSRGQYLASTPDRGDPMVWTAGLMQVTPLAQSCNDWTAQTLDTALAGSPVRLDGWTFSGQAAYCNARNVRIYCLER